MFFCIFFTSTSFALFVFTWIFCFSCTETNKCTHRLLPSSTRRCKQWRLIQHANWILNQINAIFESRRQRWRRQQSFVAFNFVFQNFLFQAPLICFYLWCCCCCCFFIRILSFFLSFVFPFAIEFLFRSIDGVSIIVCSMWV